MQRYYFDIFNGGKPVTDVFGDDFQDFRDAADLAAGLLVDLAREALPAGQAQDFGVVVRSETGGDVYRAALMFRDQYPDPQGPAASQDVCSTFSVPNLVEMIRQSRENRADSKRISHRLRESAIGLADAMRQTAETVRLAKATMAGIG